MDSFREQFEKRAAQDEGPDANVGMVRRLEEEKFDPQVQQLKLSSKYLAVDDSVV